MITTPGKVLINSVLPEKYRGSFDQLDKGSLETLLTRVAKEDPDKYIDIVHALQTIAKEVTTTYGHGSTIKLEDLRTPSELQGHKSQIQGKVRQIINDPRYSADQKKKQITDYMFKELKQTPEMVKKVMSTKDTGFGLQLRSGARGNPSALTQTIMGDLMLADANNKPVPIPSVHGYGEGLTPMEYWAAANGARKGVRDVQFATADSGYLGKQLNNIGHRTVVTEEDCGTTNGLPVDGSDVDNIGSVLASDAGGLKAGTLITKENLPKIEGKDVVVRSLVSCQAKEGVCAKCAGLREDNEFPVLGEAVGAVAARAMAEPITQAALCLAEDTEVRMADWSVKKIQNIKTGDWVLGADEDAHTYPVQVLDTFINGKKEVYETTYRYSTSTKATISLRSTLAHKMLQITKKSMCKEEKYNGIPRVLPVGDKNSKIKAVLPESFYDDDTYIKEPMALLVGLLLGDGCYTESVHGVHFSCADPTLIEELTAYMASLGLFFTQLKGHNDIYYRVSSHFKGGTQDSETGRWKTGYMNPIRRWLHEHGMLNKYAYEKEIPSVAYTWDNESIAQLIGGLIVTDGSLYQSKGQLRPYIQFASTSETLANQTRDLLIWRFGIYPTQVHEQDSNRNSSFSTDRSLFSFTISKEDAINKFYELIPLYGVKRDKKAEGKNTMASLNNRANLKYNRCSRLSQEPLGLINTYDISVDSKSHLFVLANGLIVSNSTKHSGGVAGQDTDKISGFESLNQFLQVPKIFRGGSVLARKEGIINSIKENPAKTGHIVTIGDEEHYVPNENKILVKKGQRLDAGDMLSDGVPNPAELTYYKGIGEGRRYFVNQYRKMLDDNRGSVHRRNIEALSRAFINRVEVDKPEGYEGYIIGDVIPYDDMVRNYKPRKGSTQTPLNKARNGYLEKPVLHYSIGTKLTSNVLSDLSKHKIDSILIHKDPPPFKPKVVRSVDFLKTDPDWMTRLGGEGLQKSLLQAVHRGGKSVAGGTSYFPTVADATKLKRIDKEKI